MNNDLTKEKYFDVAVVGGGAAGMMAALFASRNGAKVALIEKNTSLGKKLLLTGNGRCNLTHSHNTVREFIERLDKNGKFLFSSLSAFSPKKTIEFFNDLGLRTKTEEDGRIFPASDRSQEVLYVLEKALRKNSVKILLGRNITGLKTRGKKIDCVETADEKIYADNFILATGGKSYPHTGSDGDGYQWLRSIGHTVTSPVPALVPIRTKESWTKNLQGVSLKNVGLKVMKKDKKLSTYQGQIIFTHFGLSGPTIINASSLISRNISKDDVFLEIDLFPDASLSTLEERLKNDFKTNQKRNLKNYLTGFFPERLAKEILKLAGLGTHKKITDTTKLERMNLIRLMKSVRINISELLGFDQAMATAGGANLKEIDPKTMRSEIFNNLFLAGEILDLDGPTGGYNLQIAWTTGRTAGINAATIKNDINHPSP